jgi:hypothetical protein
MSVTLRDCPMSLCANIGRYVHQGYSASWQIFPSRHPTQISALVIARHRYIAVGMLVAC